MRFFMAGKLEELRVYQQAVEFSDSVSALLDRPACRRDRDLWKQTSEANDSITANISEGFEQGTDPMFVKYLLYAKGSLGEVIARLRRAQRKSYITNEELASRLAAGEILSRSLGAFIRYLDSCGWKDRGRYKSRLRAEARAATEVKGPATTGPGTTGPGTRDHGTRDRGTRHQGPGTERPWTERTQDQGPWDLGTTPLPSDGRRCGPAS